MEKKPTKKKNLRDPRLLNPSGSQSVRGVESVRNDRKNSTPILTHKSLLLYCSNFYKSTRIWTSRPETESGVFPGRVSSRTLMFRHVCPHGTGPQVN